MEEIKYVVWKYGVYFETLTKREILRKYELTESEFAKRYQRIEIINIRSVKQRISTQEEI